MSKNKNRRRESPQVTPNVTEKIPLVSVVMPMFNAAKFVPQTLESLLYQTMTDFEVVVVDDCSTDNSIEVVESFRERFNGRLKLIRLPKNTGTPGLPRNVGIQLARGKYISFLDCDDLYTKTALEELSTLAEKFQADVVHNDSWFILWHNKQKSVDDPAMTNFAELTNPKNFTLKTDKKTPIDNSIRFEANNITERVRRWTSWDYHWGTPSLFCLRDFLIRNQIFFPNVRVFEDMTFFFECLCKAQKFLRVPNVNYIVRPRIGSVSRIEATADYGKILETGVRVSKGVFNEFCRIMDAMSFFAVNKNFRYAVLDFFANVVPLVSSTAVTRIYAQIPAFKFNELIKKEFHPDDASLAAYLFNTVNVYRIQIAILQQQIAALKNSTKEVPDVQK